MFLLQKFHFSFASFSKARAILQAPIQSQAKSPQSCPWEEIFTLVSQSK